MRPDDALAVSFSKDTAGHSPPQTDDPSKTDPINLGIRASFTHPLHSKVAFVRMLLTCLLNEERGNGAKQEKESGTRQQENEDRLVRQSG